MLTKHIQGAVAKITGKEGLEFTGVARVFDDEDDIFEALERKAIPKGSVVIVRYQGPKGGPGMPEMCRLKIIKSKLNISNTIYHSKTNSRHYGRWLR